MKKLISLLLCSFLFSACGGGGGGGSSSAPSYSYFSYQEYNFINNNYVPYTGLFFTENGSYFFLQQTGCDNITYQISSKSISNNNITYNLTTGPVVSTNTCFPASYQIVLNYESQDSSKIYYQSTINGNLYNIYHQIQ